MYIKNKASTRIAEVRDIRADGRELYVNGEKFETFSSNAEAQSEMISIAQAIANMDDLYDLAHQIEPDDEDMDMYDEDDEDDEDFMYDGDEDDGDDEDYPFLQTQPVEQDDENYLAPLANIIPLLDEDEDPSRIRYAALILSLRDGSDYDQGDIFMDYLTDEDYAHCRKEELKGGCVILKLYDVRDGKVIIPKK